MHSRFIFQVLRKSYEFGKGKFQWTMLRIKCTQVIQQDIQNFLNYLKIEHNQGKNGQEMHKFRVQIYKIYIEFGYSMSGIHNHKNTQIFGLQIHRLFLKINKNFKISLKIEYNYGNSKEIHKILGITSQHLQRILIRDFQ